MADSSIKKAPPKTAKPRKDFPLTAHHRTGQWCKKVRGKIYYFGKLDDPDAALKKWVEQKDYLLAGLVPPSRVKLPPATAPENAFGSTEVDALLLRDLANHYLCNSEERLEQGEIQTATFLDRSEACARLFDFFDRNLAVESLTPIDFAAFKSYLATAKKRRKHQGGRKLTKKKVSLLTLRNRIRDSRAIFNWGYENGLFQTPPNELWRKSFELPDGSAITREANEKSIEPLTSTGLRSMLDHASPMVKTLLLLGINGGLGNTDVSRIERRHLSSDFTWLNLPRKKTGKPRKIPLWPETTQAVLAFLGKASSRKKLKQTDRLLISASGKELTTKRSKDLVGQAFSRLAKRLKIHRPGVNFYQLRHLFQTIGDETGDLVAVSFLMGHAEQSMSDAYRNMPSTERLFRVTEHIRKWLFETPEG